MKFLLIFKNFFRNYKTVIIIVVAVRILLLLSTFTQNPQTISDFFEKWSHWDGYRYTAIAEYGYKLDGGRNITWYPFYPLLIKMVSYTTNNFFVAGVVLSIFFSFVASIFLYKLIKIDFDNEVAIKSVWFLNIFPTAYFFQTTYSESLYLTLVLGSIYLIRRGKLLESGFWGLLTNITRPYGLTLIPVLMFEAKNKLQNLSAKSVSKILLIALIATFGFIFYLALNYHLFENHFHFLKIHEEFHSKRLAWPHVGISGLISVLRADPIYTYPEILAIILAIAALPFVYFKIRKSYALYMFLNLILFTSTSYIIGTPRYLLVVFPIFILLGKIKNKILFTLISIGSCGLLIFYSQLFLQHKWAF